MKNENQIKLFEISQYSKERIDNATLDSGTYVGVDNLLPNKEGIKEAEIYPDSGKSIKYESGDILIGNIRPYLRKIWLANNTGGTNGDVLVVRITRKDSILPEYLYYVLSSEDFFKYMIQHSRGGKMPRGDKKKVLNYSFNLPSIEEQIRIINVLNSFKDLISTLKAELELREKQLEYYLNYLIENSINEGTNWVQIKDFGKLLSGLKGKNKDDFSENGNKPFISYVEVFQNPAIYETKNNLVHIDSKENQNRLKFGDIIFTGSSEIQEEAGFSSVYLIKDNQDVYLNSFCFILRPSDIEKFDPKFLKYLFRSKLLRKEIIKSSNGVTRFNLSKGKFGRIKIPIFDLSKQEEISLILDSFSNLIENIKSEIELRQKQYEYYRDKLLDFGEEDE